jgi:hypothetical protein
LIIAWKVFVGVLEGSVVAVKMLEQAAAVPSLFTQATREFPIELRTA